MGEFAHRGINLTKIESRPTKVELGTYVFLVDLEGHREDTVVREALEAVGGPRFRTSRSSAPIPAPGPSCPAIHPLARPSLPRG